MRRSGKILLLLVICMIVLTGCEKENNSSIKGVSSGSLKASDMSIKDFEYNTEATKCNGLDCYSLSLKNNSKYDLVAIQFTYGVKDGITDSQLNVYSDFMKEHEGYIDDDDSPQDVILRGSVDRLVEKNSEMTGLNFTVGYKDWSWYDYPTEEQFNLMEPVEMQLGIIYNNKLYIAYYDFKNDSWKIDEGTFVVDIWTTKKIAKDISKPISKHFVVRKDSNEEFSIYAFGVTEDNFNKYVEELKNNGFEEENSYSNHFEGKNSNEIEVDVWYYKETQRMSLNFEIEE